jgi:signal transduction histidine kinase/CheY-like chemotaxis protein
MKRLLGVEWNALPWMLRLYVLGNYLLGAAAITAALHSPDLALSHEFVLLAIVGAIIGPRSVSLGYSADTRIHLLITHPLAFTALLTLGIPEAVLVLEVSLLSGLLTTQRSTPRYRALFNMASLGYTALAAGQVFRAFGGSSTRLDSSLTVVALLAGLLAYYVLNTLSVALAVALYNRTPFVALWRETFMWSAPGHFAGGSIALGLAFLIERLGIISLILSLPFCVLLYYSYKLYMDRLFDERKHSDEIRRINLDLEHKVLARTRELETLNQRLKESNQQLQRASHLKSEFLANMSHELRTPLNAIIGFSELLLDQTFGDLNEAQSDYVSDILSSGRHLLDLINDILDLSKIEAGRMDLRVELFDVTQLIEEAMSTLQVAADRKQIDFSHEAPADLPLFSGDRAKLKQILYNLLSNAIKFTPEGGRVWLTCSGDAESVEISVCDTGIGIRKEDQARIFDAFIQVDGSYSRKYQGTGLGLTLVKRFAELHGGSVGVESEDGQGSRFIVRLPSITPRPEDRAAVACLMAPEAPPAEEVAGSPAAGPRSEAILVVEDNAANMRLITELLRARGFTILEAQNGEEALSKLRRLTPQLILMDIQLPGMDGLACTREIRKDPKNASIPIVALTAHAMRGDEERARQAGCVGYITKPINTAQFAGQIEAFLEIAEPAAVSGGKR